jgi:integrase
MVADGINPAAQREAVKAAQRDSFATARECFEVKRKALAATTFEKRLKRFEDFVFPYLGKKPIGAITAPEFLAALKRVEARGIHETAHRLRSEGGQIFRYAVATGSAQRDICADLRGALAPCSGSRSKSSRHYRSRSDRGVTACDRRLSRSPRNGMRLEAWAARFCAARRTPQGRVGRV